MARVHTEVLPVPYCACACACACVVWFPGSLVYRFYARRVYARSQGMASASAPPSGGSSVAAMSEKHAREYFRYFNQFYVQQCLHFLPRDKPKFSDHVESIVRHLQEKSNGSDSNQSWRVLVTTRRPTQEVEPVLYASATSPLPPQSVKPHLPIVSASMQMLAIVSSPLLTHLTCPLLHGYAADHAAILYISPSYEDAPDLADYVQAAWRYIEDSKE
jgi:hypothetical protein